MPRKGTKTRCAQGLVAGLLMSLAATTPLAATGQAVEQLREMADAVESRIGGLPSRPCSLTVKWDRSTTLMEAVLSRLNEESDQREFERARLMLDDIDKFITMFERDTAETCADYEDVVAAERSMQQHLEQAGRHLLRFVNAMRGDEFPFARSKDFETFYRNVNWRDHVPRQIHWALRAVNLQTPPEQLYPLIKRNTLVDNGQVSVTLPRGEQSTWTDWRDGGWFVITNYLYYGVTESMPNGLQLRTRRLGKDCYAKSSRHRCYGHTLRKLSDGAGSYRMSTMLGRQLQSAIQPHVLAACKRTVANPEALRDLVLEHRPDDAQVRRAYDGIAERLLVDIGNLSRSGADKLCATPATPIYSWRGANTGSFVEDRLAVAIDVWRRELGPPVVATILYEKFRGRLQRELDITERRILDEYTPPFGTADAVVEAAARRGAAGPDAGAATPVHATSSGRMSPRSKPTTRAAEAALERALDHQLSWVVRARAAARAARAFAAVVVEANFTGDDTAEAQRLEVLNAARVARGHADAAEVFSRRKRVTEARLAADAAIKWAAKARAVAER